MATIIKKGTNASAFYVKSINKIIKLEPEIITTISETDFNALMAEYGFFITERTITDKNPDGCFILSSSSSNATSKSNEIGRVRDGSSGEIATNKKTEYLK